MTLFTCFQYIDKIGLFSKDSLMFKGIIWIPNTTRVPISTHRNYLMSLAYKGFCYLLCFGHMLIQVDSRHAYFDSERLLPSFSMSN